MVGLSIKQRIRRPYTMKIVVVFAVVTGIILGLAHTAQADVIAHPEDLSKQLMACDTSLRKFNRWTDDMNKTLIKETQELSWGGHITYESIGVWRRDAMELRRYFDHRWSLIVTHSGVNVEDCNKLINYFAGCMKELWDNVHATVSVDVPTTGCLGKLYAGYWDFGNHPFLQAYPSKKSDPWWGYESHHGEGNWADTQKLYKGD